MKKMGASLVVGGKEMDVNRAKYLEILDTLMDALGRPYEQPIEEVMADIKGEGIDVDVVLARLKKAQLSIALEATMKDEKRRPCSCPNGSLCEFFDKDTEKCLYGEI